MIPSDRGVLEARSPSRLRESALLQKAENFERLTLQADPCQPAAQLAGSPVELGAADTDQVRSLARQVRPLPGLTCGPPGIFQLEQ